MRAVVLIVSALLGACESQTKPPVIDDADAEARLLYPDLSALYGGEHGLYRGCGPNGGVCHNGNEFPNLSTLGSIVSSIGVPCNQKRVIGSELDDLCERPGDKVEIGGRKIEIAYFEPYQNMPLVGWRMVLRERAPAELPGENLMVWRPVPEAGVDAPFVPLAIAVNAHIPDPGDTSGRSILMAMSPDPGIAAFVSQFLVESSAPRPDRIRVGDANKNGTFGAELGGGLIAPGDPERSYLLRRLTDPTKGPLMPRANCCSWTRTALRALWCWIDGLAPDASNALDPIDYRGCRPSPSIELLYPEPGPMCEAQGLCPVSAGSGTGDATFASIYAEILTVKCAGAGCHDRGDPGGVDFRSQSLAFATLSERVTPFDPAASLLVRRLDPALCTGTCSVMPLGRSPLLPDEMARIRQWITDGAAPE